MFGFIKRAFCTGLTKRTNETRHKMARNVKMQV